MLQTAISLIFILSLIVIQNRNAFSQTTVWHNCSSNIDLLLFHFYFLFPDVYCVNDKHKVISYSLPSLKPTLRWAN